MLFPGKREGGRQEGGTERNRDTEIQACLEHVKSVSSQKEYTVV